MSKSKGNVKTLADLIARGIDPMAFRYFFLQAHYRQQQTFSDASIQAAAKGYQRLQKIALDLEGVEGEGSAELQAPFAERFRQALADDLNAPRAMAVVWDVARSAELADVDRRDLLRRFDRILGLRLGEAPAESTEEAWEQDPRIDGLLADREAARAAKDWATADRIRDEFAAEGIEIVDSSEGPRWRRVRGG
jgi:cysteinyl-tRNA synthetase